MKEKKLKLYIWRDIRCDYTCGIGFAMAYSAKEARQKIAESSEDWEWPGYKYELDSKPEVHKKPFGAWISGGG